MSRIHHVKSNSFLKMVVVLCTLYTGMVSVIDFVKTTDIDTVNSTCTIEYKSKKVFFWYIVVGSLLCTIPMAVIAMLLINPDLNLDHKYLYYQGLLFVTFILLISHVITVFLFDVKSCYAEQYYLHNSMLFSNAISIVVIFAYIRFNNFYIETSV